MKPSLLQSLVTSLPGNVPRVRRLINIALPQPKVVWIAPETLPETFSKTEIATAIEKATAVKKRSIFAVFDNPMQVDVTEDDFRPVPEGATIASLVPDTTHPVLCKVNGDYISRSQWHVRVPAGAIVMFEVRPLGGKGGSNPLRALLQIALMVGVAFLVGPAVLGLTGITASLASAGLMALGSLLINALVPLPKTTNAESSSVSSNYSVALQGNSARLDGAIPVPYGLNRMFGDFAVQPYSEFVNNEQFYYAVMCLGYGRQEIKRQMMADTALANFADVTTLIVGPGNGSLGTQALIDTSMITSEEVSGQELNDVANWTSWYTVSRAGSKTTELFADIIASKGVGHAEDNGDLSVRTLTFELQVRELSDMDDPVGDPITLRHPVTNQHYSITGKTQQPQQVSCRYLLPEAKRYEARMRRVGAYSEEARDLNDIVWAGLRAKLTTPGIIEKLDPELTYLLLKIRASKQLNGQTQRKVSVVSERKIPYWDGTNWLWVHDGDHHRNPAWICADILRNPIYGKGLKDSEMDLPSIAKLAAVCKARQDRCDIIFDTRTTVWEALTLVARCARATPVLRNGRVSFVRDAPLTVPTANFLMGTNIEEGSFSQDFMTPTRDGPDAVRLIYRDSRFWADRTVIGQYHNGAVYAYPEFVRPAGVPPPAKTVDLRFQGISGMSHALREVAYVVATSRWRRELMSFQTGLTGKLPGYGTLISVRHDVLGVGQDATVMLWEPATLTLRADQELVWKAGVAHYVRLVNRHGLLGPSIAVTKGATPDVMILATSPTAGKSADEKPIWEPVEYDDKLIDPTGLVFGTLDKETAMVRVKSIDPAPNDRTKITALVEDAIVHTVDNPYLPVNNAPQDLRDYGNIRNAVMPAMNAYM